MKLICLIGIKQNTLTMQNGRNGLYTFIREESRLKRDNHNFRRFALQMMDNVVHMVTQ